MGAGKMQVRRFGPDPGASANDGKGSVLKQFLLARRSDLCGFGFNLLEKPLELALAEGTDQFLSLIHI